MATTSEPTTAELPLAGRSLRHPLVGLGRRAHPATGSALAVALLVGVVASAAVIMVDAGAGVTPLVPRSPRIADYVRGLGGARLDKTTFLILIFAMSACYAGAIALARELSARATVVAVVAVHVVVLAGPFVLSQDIFSYVAYARLGALHGIDPYVHGPAAAAHDAVYGYVAAVWDHMPTAYGPLFTLISYPLALLGVDGALWGFKLVAAGASLGMVALVWLCARRLGRDPLLPTLVVGLNPLLVVYGVGGAHNELLMGMLMMLGVWFALGGNDRFGGAALVAAGAVKAVAIAVLPFMVVGRRRVASVVGAGVAGVAVGVVAYAAFGVHSLDLLATLRRQQTFVSMNSFPTAVAKLFGLAGVYAADRTLLRAGLAVVVVYLLVRTWRGYDWIAASAWTLLAIAVASTWLLGWYTLWALPLAALARDRRVIIATLAVQLLLIVGTTAPLFSPT